MIHPPPFPTFSPDTKFVPIACQSPRKKTPPVLEPLAGARQLEPVTTPFPGFEDFKEALELENRNMAGTSGADR